MVRVKLGNTQTLPNGNLFIGYVDLVVVAEGVNGVIRATGKSDVVNNQLNVLTRALGYFNRFITAISHINMVL